MIASWIKTAGRAHADRRELFDQLAADSNRQAHSVALRLTGSHAEAEDLVQESYLRAYRFFHRYDQSLPFTSWLYRIMTNLHIDRVRRQSRLRTVSMTAEREGRETTWDHADEGAAADRPLMESTLDEDIQLGLRSMNPEFRMAVILTDLEGMSYEEVAQVMECSVGTVRSRIHRGRRHLRDYLVSANPDRFAGAGK